MLQQLLSKVNLFSLESKAINSQRFFKTWVWEYWYWDEFLWISVPDCRKIAKEFCLLDFNDLEYLLKSKKHEHRLIALLILRFKFDKDISLKSRENIINFSFKNIKSINNWDLVDLFIPYVFWEYFFDKDKSFIYDYVKSSDLWFRRISVLTCFYDIKKWFFNDILQICELLLNDNHDLIHKSTWWMLREIWKKDEKVLLNFLDKYHKVMPRTMLRYSIEKLDVDKKNYYMKK